MMYLELILYPIILVMKWVLELGHILFSSYGLAIIFLSIVVSIATYPLSIWATRVQEKDTLLRKAMQPKIDEAKAKYKGEERFLEIEKIYKEHGYHPLHSMRSVVGIAPQIPFLLSSLLLLWHYPPLVNTPFLILPDLSRPDGLIPALTVLSTGPINLLPLVMTALSVIESFVRTDMDSAARIKIWIVYLVLLVLVYTLPSAVLLYWTCSNLLSLLKASLNAYASAK